VLQICIYLIYTFQTLSPIRKNHSAEFHSLSVAVICTLNMDMLQKMKCGQEDKWIRTGCLQTDMLHAFESGDWYDCTIRVGFDLKNPKASYKVCRDIFGIKFWLPHQLYRFNCFGRRFNKSVAFNKCVIYFLRRLENSLTKFFKFQL
jgi:hypothetical protein